MGFRLEKGGGVTREKICMSGRYTRDAMVVRYMSRGVVYLQNYILLGALFLGMPS